MFKINEWQPKRRLTMPPAPRRKSRKAYASKAHALDDDPWLDATPYADPTAVPLSDIFKTSSIVRVTQPTEPPTDEANVEVVAITVQPIKTAVETTVEHVEEPACASDEVEQEESPSAGGDDHGGQVPPWQQSTPSQE